MNRHERRAGAAKARGEMKFVNVPLTGWHLPRPGEMEIESLKTGARTELPGAEIYLANGDNPQWFWIVVVEVGAPPQASAMYCNGQSVPLGLEVSKMLLDIARKQSGVEVLSDRDPAPLES